MGRRRTNNLDLPPHMQIKHGAYYFVGRDKKWIRLSEDKALALAKWAELEGEIPFPPNEEKPIKGSLGELIMRYMIEIAPHKAKSTYQGNKLEAENLKKVFSKVQARAVLPTHIAKYLDTRGITSQVRANREIALLSHIYTYGMRWGVVNSNPCIGVAKHKEKGRDRYIMDNEFEGVKNIASELIAIVMDMAYITALRKGDILSLKLEQVTDEGIWIKQNKTGAKQLYEWSIGLHDVVDRAKALKRPIRGLYLFCTRQGKPYSDSGFKAMWNRVQVKWAEQGGSRFTFHDIRAKALTDAKNLGMDAQSLAGHSSAAMTEHYIKQREFKRVIPLK
ncbi:tyrosine-type recombinase/integrase [Methylotenera versatilis]|uniref:Integrase family protein n=1 Tax=Methylotenera versatilis (strain 301) TaxID=666681 RepID=D7DKD1_METV0|nr:tyrosine-type recombinase/integrase [Methylotenera versatilis]ADI28516.1 integrase family protein [Methylotenera versatilis 301]